jgi:hypothetical protein
MHKHATGVPSPTLRRRLFSPRAHRGNTVAARKRAEGREEPIPTEILRDRPDLPDDAPEENQLEDYLSDLSSGKQMVVAGYVVQYCYTFDANILQHRRTGIKVWPHYLRLGNPIAGGFLTAFHYCDHGGALRILNAGYGDALMNELKSWQTQGGVAVIDGAPDNFKSKADIMATIGRNLHDRHGLEAHWADWCIPLRLPDSWFNDGEGTLRGARVYTPSSIGSAVLVRHMTIPSDQRVVDDTIPVPREAPLRMVAHLISAVDRGDVRTVGNLLSSKVNPEHGDRTQRRPMHEAARRGNMRVLSMLHAAGAEPTSRNNTGQTPLSIAALNGHPEVVTALLRVGAEPESTSNGETPLELAAKSGHEDICGILVSLTPREGVDRAAMAAKMQGHVACAKACLGHRTSDDRFAHAPAPFHGRPPGRTSMSSTPRGSSHSLTFHQPKRLSDDASPDATFRARALAH